MIILNRKTLLFLLIFLLVVNISIAARIDVNLTKTKYGPQRSIEGELLVDINKLPNSTKMLIELNGAKSENDFYCGSIIPATYSMVESGLQSPIIEFASAGTNTEYAFDIINLNSPSSINAVSLKVKGIEPYPESPMLDVGADDRIEWEYIGPLIIENGNVKYIEVAPDYLFNLIPYDGFDIKIRGTKIDEYCEKIKLPLSYSYKISAFVKTLNPNGKLRARIRNTNGGELVSREDNTIKAGCSIEETSSSGGFVWKSCVIDNQNLRFVNQRDQDYYLCVYSDGQYLDTFYYEIAFQQKTAINKGYNCGNTCTKTINDIDYFIIGYYGDYQKTFNSEATLIDVLKNSMNVGACKYSLQDKDGFSHCLFPLKITSKSAGKIGLASPYVAYGPMTSDKLSKISYTPALMDCSEKQPYNLDEFEDIKTPKEPGDYKLNIQLKYGEIVYESKSVDIKVIPIPTIILNIPPQTSINMPVTFNATVFGNSPFNYSWDFGDYNASTEKNPVHTYKSLDTFEVELTVTDKNGMSDTANASIEIVSVKDILNSTLDVTRKTFDEINKQYNAATGALLDVINTLKLKDSVNEINFNLTKYEAEFKATSESAIKTDAVKELEYGITLQKLFDIRKAIPSKINVLSIIYDSKLNSYNEIPDDLFGYSSDLTSQKESIFELQNNLDVKSDSYSIDMDYLSGDKTSFRLVKKLATISTDSSNLSVVEYIPKTTANSIIDKQILTPGFSIIEADPIIKWPASNNMHLVYKLDAGSLDSLIDTRTFLFSGDIIKTEFVGEPVCGDGVCSVLEEGYCDTDCKPKYPWLFIIFIVLLVIGGVYYINFYKGKWNFKELANLISVKLTNRRLFVSDQDKISLQNYIRASLARGFNENQIISILLKKGWSRNQIDYIFKSIGKK